MLVQFNMKNVLSFKDETTLDMTSIPAYKEHQYNLIHGTKVFFASPFWKKLQSKNGQPCMSKKDKVARIPGTHGAGMNPLQTGYLYQR